MPKRLVAIAGGMGVGKSTALAILKQQGKSVVDLDEVNRGLLQDPQYLAGLKALFPLVFETDGTLNKSALKTAIASDSAARERLNAYAHPKILDALMQRAAASADVLFVEIPLLKGFEQQFDKVLVLTAPLAVRIRHIVGRDGVDEETAKALIAMQPKQEELVALADVVIENVGDYDLLTQNVVAFLNEL